MVAEQFAVRPLAPDDLIAWKALWEGYNAFYGREGTTALPDRVTETTWSRFFDPAEPMQAFVADASGTLLGLAHCILHRSTTQTANMCYMQDLFAAPAARGSGVGRALIAAVYEYAKAAGCRRVYWQTHESNVRAMKLYDKVAEKSGFIVYRMTL